MGIAICARCKNFHTRAQVELFSPSDLQTPGILKSKVEWDQQIRQRAEIEVQRFKAGDPFLYEPHHFPWCAAYTPDLKLVEKAKLGDEDALQKLMLDGRIKMNPVTGEIMPIYALCDRINTAGECRSYDPKKFSSEQEGI